MEKRLGIVAILVKKRDHVDILNSIFSSYNEIILGRQGIPLKEKGIHIITLVVDGTNDQISALTGKIGKLDGIQVKSVLTAYKESTDDSRPAG